MITESDAEFTALVQRQSRFVFKVAYAVLQNSHDAEDAVQETFLKLFRNRGWEQADNERAFLARVAWRTAVDLRRQAGSVGTGSDPAALGENQASMEPGPDHAFEAANQQAVVHAMIDALSEELRIPLVLSSFEDLNSREIGEILGIPEGTVRTRLQRARLLLRQKLASLQVRNQEGRYA